MKLHKGRPFYGYNHEAVFKGTGTIFCNEFTVRDDNGEWTDIPVAVYKRADGNYVMLWQEGDETKSKVRKSFANERYIEGVFCGLCGVAVYSKFFADCQYCPCGACYIKGGRTPKSEGGQIVNIDLLTDKVESLRKVL